jgi:hypothetical protein
VNEVGRSGPVAVAEYPARLAAVGSIGKNAAVERSLRVRVRSTQLRNGFFCVENGFFRKAARRVEVNARDRAAERKWLCGKALNHLLVG